MTKHFVAYQNDLKEGDMKALSVGTTDLLLIRIEGRIDALHPYCTHYGAPLAQGVLSGSRIVCPWHHACFSARTGNCSSPRFRRSTHFEVTLDGDEVWVEVPDEVPEVSPPAVVNLRKTDTRTFVILGAGAAGAMAAETLRRDGFTGRVVLVAQEGLPYDRPLLSKDYLASEKTMGWIPLRGQAFCEAHGVALLKQAVTQLDPQRQQLTFDGGDTLHYDALLLATGSAPKPLELPGAELDGVFYLRTLQDSQDLVAAAKEGTAAVIIGASFIGMECASSLRERGLKATVVTPDAVPFEKRFGREVGEMFRKLHEANGVTFANGRLARFSGEGRVKYALLEDGRALPAELAVIGVGVAPNVPEIRGLEPNEDGSVSVDRFLRLAGITALFMRRAIWPVTPTLFPAKLFASSTGGWRCSTDKWRRTTWPGARAFTGAPLFWTKQHGVGLRYVRHAQAWDEVVIDGDLGAHEFLAYYLSGGELRAVLGAQKDAECAVEERFRLGTLPPVTEIRARKVRWLT